MTNMYFTKILKRILFAISALICVIILLIMVFPWFLIGMPLFLLRWLFTGKDTAYAIFAFGGIILPINMLEVFYDCILGTHRFKRSFELYFKRDLKEYFL